MLHIKQHLNRRLSRRETAVVILIVPVLTVLGYLGYNFATAKMLEARVGAAMPKVCASIREQRQTLVDAIEAYKAHFGFYPPDHVVSRQPLVVDAVKNPLLYELAGVIYNLTNKLFELDQLEPADAKFLKEFFQCDGLKNCGERPDQIRRFLTIDFLPARQLHDDPDVFAVGFTVPNAAVAPEMVWEFEISPWRYVSSSPTTNPGKFDLWLEVTAKSKTVTIGNWKGAD
jgi:hypothetical protein